MRAIITGCAMAALAASAASAQQASRTPDQIVCELTGDCGAAGVDRSRLLDKPEEAAFRFDRGDTRAAPAAPTRTQTASTQNVTRSRTPATAQPQRQRSADTQAARGLDMRITFNLGSSEMTPQGRAEAEAFAKALQSPTLVSRRFLVQGHTDAIGDSGYNLRLSQDRADAVASFLKSQGISADRLEAQGFGFNKPLKNMARTAPANRRVELVPAS